MNTPEMQLKLKEAREKLKDVPFWTNGIRNKRCSDCPGEDWYLGYTYSEKTEEFFGGIMEKLKRKLKNVQVKIGFEEDYTKFFIKKE